MEGPRRRRRRGRRRVGEVARAEVVGQLVGRVGALLQHLEQAGVAGRRVALAQRLQRPGLGVGHAAAPCPAPRRARCRPAWPAGRAASAPPSQRARVVAVQHQQVEQGGMSWRCWYCAWKVMVLSNSATTASKPPSSNTAPVSKAQPAPTPGSPGARGGGRWRAAASRRRASCGRSARRSWRPCGRTAPRARASPRPTNSRRRRPCGAAAPEFLLGAHDEVPLLLRQPLAHRGRRIAHAAQVVADAGGFSCRPAPAISERSNTRRACVAAGTLGSTRPLPCAQLAQPGQQRLRRLVLAVQAFEREPRQPRRVLGALGVAAQPEQVLGRAAGDRAARCACRPPDARGAAGWWCRPRPR
jgi:hypothetical protein